MNSKFATNVTVCVPVKSILYLVQWIRVTDSGCNYPGFGMGGYLPERRWIRVHNNVEKADINIVFVAVPFDFLLRRRFWERNYDAPGLDYLNRPFKHITADSIYDEINILQCVFESFFSVINKFVDPQFMEELLVAAGSSSDYVSPRIRRELDSHMSDAASRCVDKNVLFRIKISFLIECVEGGLSCHGGNRSFNM